MRKAKMLSTKEFAEAVDVAYTTVMGWLRARQIPGAWFDESIPRGGVWWIPEAAVVRFKKAKRGRGRPRKATTTGRKAASQKAAKRGR
jgi:hypothetical protein